MSGDDLSCCPTFDHLQLVDICFSVWAPHGTGIFYYRVKKTKDGLLLSRVCIPFKVLGDSDSKIHGRLFTGHVVHKYNT